MFFVIFALSENHAEHAIDQIAKIPKIGSFLEKTLTEFLNNQKKKLHRTGDNVNLVSFCLIVFCFDIRIF